MTEPIKCQCPKCGSEVISRADIDKYSCLKCGIGWTLWQQSRIDSQREEIKQLKKDLAFTTEALACERTSYAEVACDCERVGAENSRLIALLKEIEDKYLISYQDLSLSTQYKNALGECAEIAKRAKGEGK